MRPSNLLRLAFFLSPALACSSGGLQVGHDLNAVVDSGAEAGSACQAAGGNCVPGNVTCATQAVASAQDCNPDRNPGGTFCCLSEGSGSDGGASDAGGSDGGGDAGPGEAGAGGACKSAGGTCVLGNVTCATQAPDADQDCNPDKNPGGAFCCLSVETACEKAGGSCVLGNVTCSKKAPRADQDCNPDRNPGGSFCCLVR